jgi:hypothetical protein
MRSYAVRRMERLEKVAAQRNRKGVRVFAEMEDGTGWLEWVPGNPEPVTFTSEQVDALSADGWQVVRVIYREAGHEKRD